jgi:ATP-binding cassette subfamily B (MDR/TAP) protein 1
VARRHVQPDIILTKIKFGFRVTSLRTSAAIRLHYLQCLFLQPISTLDALPPGQTSAIITITANILQLGISERLSSLIQAIAVIVVALIIGCIYSWSLTLVTASGLIIIMTWYSVMTPLVLKRYAAVQEVERGASGVAAETLTGIRMVAACGAEEKMSSKYDRLIDQASTLSKASSLLLAVQHSPGQSTSNCYRHHNSSQCSVLRYFRVSSDPYDVASLTWLGLSRCAFGMR